MLLFLFQMLYERQSTKKKTNPKNTKPLQQFQRKETQTNNKNYTQDISLQPNSTHMMIKHNLLIGKYLTNLPRPTGTDKSCPSQKFSAIRVIQKGNRRTFAPCNGATREFAGIGGNSSEWSLCANRRSCESSCNFWKMQKSKKISSLNLVSGTEEGLGGLLDNPEAPLEELKFFKIP